MRYLPGHICLPPLLVGLFWLSDAVADEPVAVADAATPAPEASAAPKPLSSAAPF